MARVLLNIGIGEAAVTVNIDRKRFGPWALITGASSGIGREFAERIAASGIHVVLVARREAQLHEAGLACSQRFNVQHRVIAADLSVDGFVSKLADATRDLDIGLVISNAGSANPGRFLNKEPDELAMTLRLSALAHAGIALHYGRKLIKRGTGGLVFVGAMGAPSGAPFMAHDGGAKAYVESLGLALHEEFKRYGVCVTVLAPGPTDTPVLAKFGLDPKAMPMKPMQARQVVREGLKALSINRALIIPGRMNRVMRAVVPASLTRSILRTMFEKMPEQSKPPSGLGTG
jgi:short-subunit dehydrogenase